MPRRTENMNMGDLSPSEKQYLITNGFTGVSSTHNNSELTSHEMEYILEYRKHRRSSPRQPDKKKKKKRVVSPYNNGQHVQFYSTTLKQYIPCWVIKVHLDGSLRLEAEESKYGKMERIDPKFVRLSEGRAYSDSDSDRTETDEESQLMDEIQMLQTQIRKLKKPRARDQRAENQIRRLQQKISELEEQLTQQGEQVVVLAEPTGPEPAPGPGPRSSQPVVMARHVSTSRPPPSYHTVAPSPEPSDGDVSEGPPPPPSRLPSHGQRPQSRSQSRSQPGTQSRSQSRSQPGTQSRQLSRRRTTSRDGPSGLTNPSTKVIHALTGNLNAPGIVDRGRGPRNPNAPKKPKKRIPCCGGKPESASQKKTKKKNTKKRKKNKQTNRYKRLR
jgi:hypothetical protein